MSDARSSILETIRRAPLALARQTGDLAIAREAASLLEAPDLVRPPPAMDDVVAAFAARLAVIGVSCGHVGDLAEFPAAVGRYVERQNLPPALYVQPDPRLRSLDWRSFVLHDVLASDEVVGVGLAQAGIAETGSLVFASGAETAVLGHFLPTHHVVGLSAAQIFTYLDDIPADAAAMPRNLNLVTGPSGTTDIEGEFVLGAHGPRYLHVILIGDTVP